MIRLTTPANVEEARLSIRKLLEARVEWFCAEARGGPRFELRRGDWDLRAERGHLFITLWGEKGARVWRVAAWECTGGKLLIEATRRAGAERTVLEFVPRASALEGRAQLQAARLARCERMAALACQSLPASKIEQSRLSAGARRGEPGRYARIVLRSGCERVCATGPVVALGLESADAFLASALLWFERISGRGEKPARRLLLVVERGLARATAERVALLREGLRHAIEMFEADENLSALEPVRMIALGELLDESPRFIGPSVAELSETARLIVALAPEAIDVVRARQGETLRFRGLAFARVRRLLGKENAWFGVEGAAGMKRRVLDEASRPDLLRLLGELDEHRREGATDRRHALFRAAPEAWLESLLRRDVTRLDPGLRLAPLHAQFRTARAGERGARPVDLLALRRDGRLVVVELKVSEDASLALQGADYWRRVETHRRRGHITAARLFDDAQISDEPPLVYLVAPMLRFHRAFPTLARAITPEIEMYRFDLNEDWRAGVRVVRRGRVV